MKVWHFTPWSNERDLGAAYNEYMSLIPDGDAACIRDMDTMFLTPDAGQIIQQVAEANAKAVLVCYTNRIYPTAKTQLSSENLFDSTDILKHIKYADLIRFLPDSKTSEAEGPLSGFLMVIPKAIWKIVPFRRGRGLLGVDTQFFKDLRTIGIPILRINHLYIFHIYRMKNGIDNKMHLL